MMYITGTTLLLHLIFTFGSLCLYVFSNVVLCFREGNSSFAVTPLSATDDLCKDLEYGNFYSSHIHYSHAGMNRVENQELEVPSKIER
jgi:hypothetical protein